MDTLIDSPIIEFSLTTAFLSNFYEAEFVNTEENLPNLPIALNYAPPMTPWHTVEHYYQACKTADPDRQWVIAAATSPGRAKRLGGSKSTILRPYWDQVKAGVMLRGLWYKFTQNPTLLDWLTATGNAYLLEGNTWHDNEWGHCFCNRCKNKPGQNLLGRLLMELRGVL